MDVLVVGCGLTGGVIARELAEQGRKVTVWDRREHIGGNMYDYVDEHGILVHKYGPHTFHTKDKLLYDYMCRFGEWQEYKLTCGAMIKGKFTPTPFNFHTIDTFYAEKEASALKAELKAYFSGKEFATVLEVMNADNECIRKYGEFLFAHDYSLYTAKQWGIAPEKVDPSILKRVPLRFSYEEGYFDDEYQMMPKSSYVDWFRNLLDHPNITVELGVEALEHLSVTAGELLLDGVSCKIPVVYTGALDELFGQSEGSLPYRSLRFEWRHEDIESKQPYPVTAYPEAESYTRITEYKKMPVQNVTGTTYAVEYPLMYKLGEGMEPYYPVLTEESQRKAAVYKSMAEEISNLYPCGRLADFKYYNMDQALARAMSMVNNIRVYTG